MAQADSEEISQPGEAPTIRICVLGPTGAGKSTLCNFISQSDVFEVGDGFDSCTKEAQPKNFTFPINGIHKKFSIIDTPGWFDTDEKEDEEAIDIEWTVNNIKQCLSISNLEITAFFIVVPFERILVATQQTIHFMTDCFDSTQRKHIYMVFTKCGKKSCDEIMKSLLQQKQKRRK